MASDGFAAGLKYWLVFLLGFYLLGYSAIASIGLGALAGFAGGLVVAYWRSKERPPAPVVEQMLSEEDVKRSWRRTRRSQASEAEKNRPKRGLFGFFRQRRKHFAKPRR